MTGPNPDPPPAILSHRATRDAEQPTPREHCPTSSTTTEREKGETMTGTMIPAAVFHPGEFLRDELDERGWAIAEFAEIIGRPVQAVPEIINGRPSITPETAAEVGHALGTSAALWLNLQTAYQSPDGLGL
jgi:HTH-type transcriptional regulator/antitoxin HigA